MRLSWRFHAKAFGLAAAVFVASLIGSSCGDDAKETRKGRGDAPVGHIDESPAEVIAFPDTFSNVATKCDGHGHRLYVTTQNTNGKQLSVISDPGCAGTPG